MTELSKRVQVLIAILFAATLVIAGCGGDQASTTTDQPATTATTAEPAAATQPATMAPANPSAPEGSAEYVGITAGQADASGMAGSFNLTEANENIKAWNVVGFKYAKKADGSYSPAEHPDITNWDQWAGIIKSRNIQPLIDSIPDGYMLEIRGHADKTGPEQAVGNKRGNQSLSQERAMGIAQALARNQVDFKGKVFYSGVGSSQNVPDADMLPNGRSRLNRRVTFHIVPR
jgi:hypothetical protein